MSTNKIIAELDAEQMSRELPEFAPGDTVVVQVRVKEGNRERLQAFEGVCIGKRNRGLNSAFILVINFKYKKLDKRKALYKTLNKTGFVFESKKLYENQVAEWIRRILAGQNYNISPKASQMLVEFLGTDLSKIDNELNKLKIVLPEGTQITPEHIEENIGISKDFNNFELRKAVGDKDIVKAHRIAKYFADNPKDNPMVVTISLLFSFFSQLLHLHGMNDKTPRSVASALRINPYFVNEYLTAARNYPMKKVSTVIALLRDFDVKGKGVGASAVPQGDLLKELLVRILN